MSSLLRAVLQSNEKADLRQFISQLRSEQEQYFLRNQILQAFDNYCTTHDKPAYFKRTSSIAELLNYTHEIILEEKNLWLLLRTRVASQEIYRLAADLASFEPMPVEELLSLRDRWVKRYFPEKGGLLEIDVGPFYKNTPTIRDPRKIGNGLEFLNRYLSSQLFADSKQWLEELLKNLRAHHYDQTPLLLNNRIDSTTQLFDKLKEALTLVGDLPAHTPYEKFRFELQVLGFEAGWGNTAGRVRETLELLERLMDAPDHAVLEAFISRIPLIFRVVLVSVHGWVGQEGVLGLPETAGQVAYVIDQASSLEQTIQNNIKLSGLEVLGVEPKVIVLTRLIPNCEGTQCNLRLEKIQGTSNGWILRVPFQEFNPNVTQNWISKFEIWPYLESFALDSEKALLEEFQGSPDLIIGNYSDGSLVAFLLARRLNAIHGSIAHTMEKPKYLFSDLYWKDFESQYNFSIQFTADLIAMNSADFILTSTYEELVGTPNSVGYYESYKSFSMPELYHVVNGIELFSPKFNVVPPGVNENIFFPYTQTSDRIAHESERVKDLLLSKEDPEIIGYLNSPKQRPILSIAPLTSIKNLTGLVECFASSKELQQQCNLILITSHVRVEDATDPEEKGEIEKLNQLIKQYHLQGKIRWIGLRLTTPDIGESYRVIADLGGILVHPARFEAFGLTVLEAMISGLPTFATQFGGPSEIIQNGDNGFLINPTDLQGTAEKIQEFISKCEHTPDYWQKISQAGIKRVRDKYNWQLHTKQLLSLAKIYGFWSETSKESRETLLRYLEALFYLIYKPRATNLLAKHSSR
ncbi:sucrose synthase [Moorena producens]|uniref:sucrose synthase n=1 Tax=Moorena producens TaxID=1155739 RepID=UPI003C76D0A1